MLIQRTKITLHATQPQAKPKTWNENPRSTSTINPWLTLIFSQIYIFFSSDWLCWSKSVKDLNPILALWALIGIINYKFSLIMWELQVFAFWTGCQKGQSQYRQRQQGDEPWYSGHNSGHHICEDMNHGLNIYKHIYMIDISIYSILIQLVVISWTIKKVF